MKDLANILETIAKDDRKFKRDPLQQRRFIIVEGLYHNTGKLCPLPEIVELKYKYFYRIILDESLSFGTIGNTGRGVTEYYGVKVAMDCTLASIGGGCIGTREIVDHQRLSGSGYCFSASAPPFLFASAIETLNLLENKGQDMLINLKSNVKSLLAALESVPHVHAISNEESPVIQLVLNSSTGYDADVQIMQQISEQCLQRGIGLVATSFDCKLLVDLKKTNQSLNASLRINVSTSLTNADIKKIVKELNASVVKVLGK